MTRSMAAASPPAPVPRSIARWVASLGSEKSRALWMAAASVKWARGSPARCRAWTVSARATCVNLSPARAAAAVLLERLAVYLYAAALAQVAHQIGVDGALVLATALRVARPHRHVHGAADLLVEEHVAGAAVDAEIGTDPELAQPARALVGVQ